MKIQVAVFCVVKTEAERSSETFGILPQCYTES